MTIARRALPWVCAVIACLMAAKKLIGGYADLGIYLDTATEFRTGGIDLFRAREATGPWAYPHFAVLPYAGLQVVLGSDHAVRWVYCVLLGLGTAWIVADLPRILRPLGGLKWWQWVVFGVLFQRCLAQNLTHGQISLFVAALVIHGIRRLQAGHDHRAGLMFGLAAALKITPVLFLIALLPMRRSRAAMTAGLTIAVAVLLVPWPFCGTADHVRHLTSLWNTLAGSVTETGDVPILKYYGGASIRGTLDYLLQARPYDVHGRTANLVDLGDTTFAVVKVGWSLLLAGLLGHWFWRARSLPAPHRLAVQCAVVTLAMSFYSPIVRVYHLSAALVAFVLFCRGPRSRTDLLWWATSALLLFTMTLRQRNLLGEALWRALDVYGFLHIELILLTIWCWRHSTAETTRASDAAPASPLPESA